MSDPINDLRNDFTEMKLQVSKLESHLESEQGNAKRQSENFDKRSTKLEHKVFGNGKEGLEIRIDRLEQAEKRAKNWNKYLLTAICALAVKIGYDLIKAIKLSL